jgi:hypothetical protein
MKCLRLHDAVQAPAERRIQAFSEFAEDAARLISEMDRQGHPVSTFNGERLI